MEITVSILQKQLSKIEEQLMKVRGCSPLTHGWQTQKFSKASRKWDELAKRKMEIKDQLDFHLAMRDGDPF